jgi:peptide maturation system protein (TIGR04066 family)
MRTPIALYPYSSTFLPIVNHFEELQNKYSLCKLYSLPGFGLIGNDAAYACNHPKTNILVTDDHEIDDQCWNTLLLTKLPEENLVGNIHLFDVLKGVLDIGKSVIYYDNDQFSIPKGVKDLKESYRDKLQFQFENHELKVRLSPKGSLSSIEAPIIFVGSLVESSDSFEVLCNLARHFRKHNYHPIVFTKHAIGQLFGFHTIRHIFDQQNLTESQKIEEINQFVAALEHDYRPDVILVEAPDSVMRFNDAAPNGFGILTYMLTQALCIDSFICCVPFELAVNQLLEMLSKDFSVRLGSPIHAVHVSNIVVDSASILQTHEISYVHADLNRVHKHITREFANSSIPLFNVVSDGSEKLFQLLYRLLNLQY